MKLSTCPGEQAKYSGTFAGISAAALLAVTTAVLPRHARMTVLLEGDRTECLAMEKKLRPKRNRLE